MTLAPIESVQDAIGLVDSLSGPLAPLLTTHNKSDDLFPDGIWFRGQTDHTWPLEPHAFRLRDNPTGFEDVEAALFHKFRMRQPELRDICRCQLDWLCLMQHYDLPTRLLDFTENVLVALYFAVCESAAEDTADGALFALSAYKLNEEVTQHASIAFADAYEAIARAQLATDPSVDWMIDRLRDHHPNVSRAIQTDAKKSDGHRTVLERRLSMPVAVEPNKLTSRLLVQESVLVLHGGTHATHVESPVPCPVLLEQINTQREAGDPVLLKFHIPASKKEIIRRKLSRIGIHHGFLFPEVEHQSKHVLRKRGLGMKTSQQSAPHLQNDPRRRGSF